MKVVDMHCDTISEIYYNHRNGGQASILDNDFHIDLMKMKDGDYGLQNFGLFVHMGREEKPFEHCMKLVDTFYQEMEVHRDLIGIVTSYDEIEQNWKYGKMSALLTIEEGGVCQGNVEFLRNFYRLGVRMMTLTWNYKNELGYPHQTVVGDGGKKQVIPDNINGLTETGISFIREMERLGMIIDVSHLSDAGIWDVFRHTKAPFVASHSNARSVASHPRNLTDKMIKALADRGGVMGMNYYHAFLKDLDLEVPLKSMISDIITHMKHIRRVGGIECISLGSDFDGIDGDLEMKSARDLPMLEGAMRQEGFTEAEIEAVFYKNVLRVYREVLKG